MPISSSTLQTEVLGSTQLKPSLSMPLHTQEESTRLLAPCAAHALRAVIEDPDLKGLAPRGWVDLWVSEAAIAKMRSEVPAWMAWQRQETTFVSFANQQSESKQKISLQEARRAAVFRVFATLGESLLKKNAPNKAFSGSLAMVSGRPSDLADEEFVALTILCARPNETMLLKEQLRQVQIGLEQWGQQFLPPGQWVVTPGQPEQLLWDRSFPVEGAGKQIRFWKPSDRTMRRQFADFARAQLERVALASDLEPALDPQGDTKSMCVEEIANSSLAEDSNARQPAEALLSGLRMEKQEQAQDVPGESSKKVRSSLRI